MKIKLLFAFLLVSFFAVAQPTNYQRIAARYKWIAGMYDSTLHIPSGVTPALRGGGWTGAGAIFFNTTDSSLYVYSGYNWRKIGSDVDSLIYSTRAWRQKGDDSLGAVINARTLQQVLSVEGNNAEITTTTDIYSSSTSNDLIFGDNGQWGSIQLIPLTSVTLQSGNSSVVSAITVALDTIYINPHNGNLKIDTLDYTLSTIGKKILIRDTVSGLVENIDPALISGGSITFSNGLTEAAGAVKLGGTLTENTKVYIDNGYNMNFDLDPGAGSFSVTNDVSDTAFIIRDHLNIFFPNIPSVLSTTGKKIMLRDTATGLIQNIDPALLGFGATNTLAVFGAGAGLATDTAAFQTTSIYGSFFWDGTDTLVVTKSCVTLQGTSANIDYDIYFNDSLNVTAGASTILSSINITSTTTAYCTDEGFITTKIPPGNWVWVKTSTLTTKPTYFSLSLIGYKKRVI